MRVSDYIAKFLVTNHMSTVFMVSGGGIMHLIDGLACNNRIKVVCAHHEGAAAVMAEGYARVTNHPGVLLVTTGPGGTNAITGVVDAWVDSIPMLVISGQAKRSQNVYNSKVKVRSLGGQEVNILPIVESFTKYSVMVNEPEKIRYYLERAVYEAENGRPGPVWLDIPLDVQAADISTVSMTGFEAPDYHSDIKEQVCRVSGLLESAHRPVIIAGHGIRLSGAERQFKDLINLLKVPVVSSKLGFDILEYDHPCYIGPGGTKGTRAANFAMQNADLILAIGSRLAIPFTGYEYDLFAREATKISVDIDQNELDKDTIKLDMKVKSDAGVFIGELIKKMNAATYRVERPMWTSQCREWKTRYPVVPEIQFAEGVVTIYGFFETLSRLSTTGTILVADAGSTYYVATQVWKPKRGQRVLIPAALGTMGFSLPMAIGAHFAAPNRQIIAVTGDGSLQMNIQELQTMFHNNVPVKLFVINNNGYASIRNTQKLYFEGRLCGADTSSGVSCPDLRQVAFAYQIPYTRISDLETMSEQIDYAINYHGPIIMEVMTNPDQQIIPSVSSKVLPDGRMVSAPLEDMWPFLPRDEFYNQMFVKPVNDE